MVEKRKMAKVTVCPKCNSPDIRQESNLSGWFLPESWVCPRCGYTGILVKEIELKNELKNA